MVTTSQTITAGQPPYLRSEHQQEDLVIHDLDLDGWRTSDNAQAKLGASAGTPAGAFGITVGTYGSAAPQIVGEAASGNSKTNNMRRQYRLPPEYVDGQSITIRVVCEETVGAATVETTIDVKARKVGSEAAIGSDLVTTTAADVTETTGNKDFTVTPTGLTAGDRLDIEVTGLTNDTGGAVGTVLAIYDTSILLDIKG